MLIWDLNPSVFSSILLHLKGRGGTMSGDDVRALVNYYARAGYGRHVQTVCGEALRSRPGDPTLSFWRAFGLILEGSYSEAIAQLESLM